MAAVYFVLALAGLIGTWYYNLHYQGDNYLADWFANPASSSAAVDIIVIGAVASVFYLRERKALPGRLPWAVIFIPLSFMIAVAFAFPLFLGLRELGVARALSSVAKKQPTTAQPLVQHKPQKKG